MLVEEALFPRRGTHRFSTSLDVFLYEEKINL